MKLPRTGASVLASIPGFLVLPLIVLPLVLSGCAQKPVQPLTGDALLLGTVVRISISDRGFNKALIDRVFDRVATIEARMSTSTDDYDNTELLRVNRAGLTVYEVSLSPVTSVLATKSGCSEYWTV